MLKAHQACIDLSKNVLRIQGREVRFLSEHELPDKARNPAELAESDGPPPSGSNPSNSTPGPSFPGSGASLGATPGQPSAPSRQTASAHSEQAISILMGLGATREVAISSLDAAGGNVDVAASLLF